MLIYGLKNCDTCRKAMRSLPDAKLVDVRALGVPADVMGHAFEAFGEALVNKRSTTWRALTDAQRAEDTLVLLSNHPTLMKRPLIAFNDQVFLGWNNEIEAEVKALS
ncbi:MAG: arsenate reductase [Sulfitobacter sp. SK025]|nr:MAG: arsenate reductase [Sulfitobacter sp. SK025]